MTQKNTSSKPLAKFKQDDLFRVLYGKSGKSDHLSNLFNLWDAFPKYSVNRATQTKMRSPEGALPRHKMKFKAPTGEQCVIEIVPAKIEIDGKNKEFYPAETEELIELICRRLFLNQSQGVHEPHRDQTYCKFTLNMIAKELKKYNKVRSLDEIKLSLEIMNLCGIEIYINNKVTYKGAIFPEIFITNRAEYLSNSETLSTVRFSSIVSQSIDRLDYRQINYEILASLPSQLARSIFTKISALFLNAGFDAPTYKLKFSDVDENSGLLRNKERRKRVDMLRKALNELLVSHPLNIDDSMDDGSCEPAPPPLLKITETIPTTDNPDKDVIFELYPSGTFILEMKASNKRNRDINNFNAPAIGSHLKRL